MSSAKPEKTILVINGNQLTIEQLVLVAREPGAGATIAGDVLPRVEASREWVEKIQKTGKPVVYGINTGFGSKATVSISKEHLRDLQRNLIMSHSAGAGDPLPVDVVRAAMLLRANTLVKGYSGVRPEVIDTLLDMLRKNVTPWIPEQGSVGASGDLAPLSHLALVLSRPPVGEDRESESGKAYWFNPGSREWELMSGKAAMARAGIPRIVLEAKEGLALNNGTQISTALLALAWYDAGRLVKQADIAMALSLEALLGISSAFREEIHQLRPHPGQIVTARNVRRLTAGSRLINRLPEKVQDAYSLRCYPQVMAGVRDTLRHIGQVLETELNATNDNPIIFPGLESPNKAVSGGNFHAQPIAFAADFLAIILSEVGSISERRIFRMSDKHLNSGLPSFLIANSGLESGLMLAQYTAAALASENKTLSHPASVDSIPTCENQEDHVSMAPIAARKARAILENVRKIVAIEMIFAAQAIDLRFRELGDELGGASPEELLGKGSAAAYRTLREAVPFMETDRPVYIDMENSLNLLRSGKILTAVETVVGELEN